MGQAGDFTTYFKGDSSYFNPTLWHNGKKEDYKGYCSDIFCDKAIEFFEKNQSAPFFCYLAFNAPHTPLQVPEPYYQKYKNIDPSQNVDSGTGFDVNMSESDKEDARKVYAMVSNIDSNIGKLLKRLDDLRLKENTIVIFMSDNGPQQPRYNAGMRGLKASVYRGGIRVPFYIPYPVQFKVAGEINIAAAHIDVLPTLAKLCDVKLPDTLSIDGQNLLPAIEGEDAYLAERSIFFYWTRRYPELYNNMALQKGNFKLVGHCDYDSKISQFELYDIYSDPFERINIVNSDTAVANRLHFQMKQITAELISSENLIRPPRIEIGNKRENPVILNRNDADGQPGIWAQEEVYGLWKVRISEGHYNIRFKFLNPPGTKGCLMLETGTFITRMDNTDAHADYFEMKNVHLPKMECDFVPSYTSGTKRFFPFWVEIEKI